jgi:hypothetical protein
LFEKARAALEPHGSAIETPKLTKEAEDLLATFATEQDVIAALLKSSGNGAAPTVSGGSAAQSATPSTQAAPPAKVVDAPTPDPRETTAQVLTELEALVGLASVKHQLKSVIAVVRANQERGKAGLAQVNSGLHLVFTGPPGTGKTTVARLVARLYAAAGALPGANFTEASRSDLIAGYVGQTAIKTADIIARTRPGVLFIDEAYSLTPTHSSDFGAEAIATLVKAMEDHRTELAIIVAGYGEEMAEFIGCNPGLTRIFESFAKAAAIGLAPGALDAAKAVFHRVVTKRDFGNARFARSLFEQAYARMAARAVADDSVTIDEVSTIIAADVKWHETVLDQDDHSIGFPIKQ